MIKLDTPRKTDITPAEEQEIAVTLQLMLLNEIFSKPEWRAPKAVFHGGTALALLYKNDRWSEDLDFMVSEDLYDSLEQTMKLAAARLQIVARKLYPGCFIDLNGPKGRNDVQAWTFGWTHPKKHGKVKVKSEFFASSPDMLEGYQTTKIVPIGPYVLPVSVATPVHGPQLISSWSDKIIAVSQREYFKSRDIYDLWFIDRRTRELAISADANTRAPYPSDEEFMTALETTARIYDKTIEDIRIGLENKLAQNLFDDSEQYYADMKKWLPSAIVEQAEVMDSHRHVAKAEVERALRLIENVPGMPKP